jgi:hypothetical protein
MTNRLVIWLKMDFSLWSSAVSVIEKTGLFEKIYLYFRLHSTRKIGDFIDRGSVVR